MLDLNKLKKVHFIGIGGVSLSSLAQFLLKKGIAVSGSDRSYGEKTAELFEKGCDVWIGVRPEKIENVDLTVYSSAISRDNEELVFCRKNSIPCMERNVFLGELSGKFGCVIAVGGTHGKTTATAMLCSIFIENKSEFYGHVGGDTVDFGNFYYSGDKYLITEACEYRKSLLCLSPDIGIVLNAENDHPDTYKNLSEIYDTFDLFLDKSRKKGYAVTNGDTAYYNIRQSHNDTVTFGFSDSDRFKAANIFEHKKGFYGFTVYDYGNPIAIIYLNIAGKVNVINALAAFTVSYLVGIKPETIVRALDSFKGVKRRFEKTSVFWGANVYTDYAHHPDEIRAALSTAKSIIPENKKIYAVFQPHTFSRTARLYNEFVKCFSDCDCLIICKEYAAREVPSDGVSAKLLFDGIEKKEKFYCDNIIDAAALLIKKVSPDDMIMVIGAGDIVNLCELLK